MSVTNTFPVMVPQWEVPEETGRGRRGRTASAQEHHGGPPRIQAFWRRVVCLQMAGWGAYPLAGLSWA